MIYSTFLFGCVASAGTRGGHGGQMIVSPEAILKEGPFWKKTGGDKPLRACSLASALDSKSKDMCGKELPGADFRHCKRESAAKCIDKDVADVAAEAEADRIAREKSKAEAARIARADNIRQQMVAKEEKEEDDCLKDLYTEVPEEEKKKVISKEAFFTSENINLWCTTKVEYRGNEEVNRFHDDLKSFLGQLKSTEAKEELHFLRLAESKAQELWDLI